MSVLADRLDFGSLDFIANPYPTLAALRAASPMFWHESTGRWIATRHSVVQAALRDRRLGRAYAHRYTDAEMGQAEPDPRWESFRASERWSLLNIEPPDHTRIRGLISKVFTPTSIAALRPRIEQSAASALAGCLERATFDLVADYAQPYSVEVICDMLGVPRADGPLLLDWSHAIVKMYEFTTTDDQRGAANGAAAEFIEYVTALIATKRKSPDDALLARLVAVEEAGERLTVDEIISTVIVLLNAGHEATVNTLGNGTRALMLHPQQWARLVAHEVTARTAVEEMLRWDAPLQLFERWVLEPGVVLAGQQLSVGDRISMLFGSANRDEEHFADADAFDVGGGDTTHVGFGGGIHFCVGGPLARLELEISLSALVAAAPGLALVDEPRYNPTFVIRGMQDLMVTIA